MRSVFALVPSLFFTTAVAAETVTFAGSSTIMPIMEAMTPVLEQHGLSPEIQGGGSSAGLKAAKMGMAEVGMMSRSLTPREQETINHKVIASDWLVIIAHADAPYQDITSEQVVGVYTGAENTLHGEKVNAIAKEGGRATKKVFDEYFKLAGKLDPGLIIIGANGQAIASVAQDPNGMAYISYIAAAKAIEQGEPIKMLTLDGVAGSPENVRSGAYDLSRSLILVYTDKNQALMDRIIAVLSTPEAAEVFAASGVMSSL